MAKKKKLIVDETVVASSRAVHPVNAPDILTLYANNINIDLSSFDVRFRLGHIVGATDTVIQVKEVAHVFMSHQHFRALVAAVNKSVEKLDKLPMVQPIADEQAR